LSGTFRNLDLDLERLDEPSVGSFGETRVVCSPALGFAVYVKFCIAFVEGLGILFGEGEFGARGGLNVFALECLVKS
jgi:hypothetical protein